MKDAAKDAAEKAVKDANVQDAVKRAQESNSATPVIVIVNESDKDKEKKVKSLRGLQAFRNA
ncbi:MAG TPA: hypothetical protein VHU87_05060 [Rhizomicrobium sp.]|nr:hypothetical protein [Rhizomicrobium sp.]